MSLTISKALPIKFWLNGQETFNEKAVPGIESFAFLQKFNLSDTIRLQLIDTDYKSYRVSVIEHDGITDPTDPDFTEIGTKDFDLSGTADGYRHDVEFTMTELGVVTGQVVKVLLISDTIPAPVPETITGDGELTGLLGTISGTITVS